MAESQGMTHSPAERCAHCGALKFVHERKRKGRVVARYWCMNHKAGCKPAETYLPGEKCYEIDLVYPGIVHGGYIL